MFKLKKEPKMKQNAETRNETSERDGATFVRGVVFCAFILTMLGGVAIVLNSVQKNAAMADAVHVDAREYYKKAMNACLENKTSKFECATLAVTGSASAENYTTGGMFGAMIDGNQFPKIVRKVAIAAGDL
jgi:glutamate dehydrogenase/leucine dehydrogenase